MPPIAKFDYLIASYTNRLPRGLKPLMELLTFIGQPYVLTVIGIAGFASSMVDGQTSIRKAFAYAFAAFCLCTFFKLSLHRPRPHGLMIKTLGVQSYSFPSGHAFGSVIFYGLFAILDLKHLTHPWNTVVAAVLWAIIFLIGVSRIYLQTHYPSDVIAGWALGAACLVVVTALAF